MLITKEQIIEAIMTEPLKPKQWFHVEYGDDYEPINSTTCEVCAVGAVLRKGCGVVPITGGLFSMPGKMLQHVGDIIDESMPTTPFDWYHSSMKLESLFKSEGYWLNKLSVVFETMCHIATDNGSKPLSKLMIEAVRLELSDYVRDEFPEIIEVAI